MAIETKVVKEITKEIEQPSFFNFFKTRCAPDDSEKSDESNDENDKLMSEMQDDADLANEIATELIPRGIYYYLGLIRDDDKGSINEEDEPKSKGMTSKKHPLKK